MPTIVAKFFEWGPAWAIIAVVFWALWKMTLWLGELLFDQEKGFVSLWFQDQRNLTTAHQEAIKANTLTIASAAEDMQAIKRQLDRALATNIDAGEQQHLIDLLIDETPVPMVILGEDGTILRSNRPAQDLFGYSGDELQGMTWQGITPDARDIAVDATRCREMASGRTTTDRLEKTFLRRDGTRVYASCYLVRFPRLGPFRHFICSILPLTPERQLR